MSIKVKVLGTGCPKCQTLEKVVKDVVSENQLEAEIVKVEDIMEIMNYNIMVTPALVVNEKVVSKGIVPSSNEILDLLRQN